MTRSGTAAGARAGGRAATENGAVPAVDTGFDAAVARRDFPALDQEINGKRLVYLDNAASTQKPDAVIDAVSNYYRHDHANVHRGMHELARRATAAYEGARAKVARFLGAPRARGGRLDEGNDRGHQSGRGGVGLEAPR